MDRLSELQDFYWQATFETLYMVLGALLLGGVCGLLLGLLLYVTRTGGIKSNRVVSVLSNVVVNTFRPIPFIILIAAAQPLARAVTGTGIGNKPAIFVMAIAATFGIARIVEQNLLTVDPGVLQAARAMGASRTRIIFTVLLPEALGPLILGYTFAVVALVDMSAVAGVVGGGGLGNFAIVYGYRQFDTVVTWAAVLMIIVIVQVTQFCGNALARKVLRR
ncbi:methionine ABC transporter permease [Nocardioides jensenii]|uniref:methionine ABC transporter permease n=1 Tax=Nocardioides jensenii TaxID=1843 RepID=UPI0008368FB0|nr:methionine ABC transporter permease [Nocardioides jensenii]